MARSFEMEELLRLPSHYAVTLSRGRDRVAYYGDRSGRMELHTLDLSSAGAEGVQVSKGRLPRSPRVGASWARGDTAIVFAKDHDGDEQHDLFSLDLRTRAVERLTDARAQHLPGPSSPDGRELLVMSNREGQLNVFVLDLDTKELRRLTRFANPAEATGWSADGAWVYFSTNETDVLTNRDVYRVSRDGGTVEKLYSSGTGSGDWAGPVSDDGRYLAIISDASGFDQPVVLELATGRVLEVGSGTGDEVPTDFSPDGTKLLSILSQDAGARPVETDLATGARTEVPVPAGFAYGARYLADGRVLVSHTDPRHRDRLLTVQHGSTSVALEAEYGRLSPEDFAPAERVSFPSSDGLRVQGLLYRPFAASGKSPAVVLVHGGPSGQDVLAFDPTVQVLVNRGFVVLQVNYRGSTGYGRDFRDLNIGDIGGGDAEDVAAGARFLQGDAGVDASRILCVGVSYGGYMTYRQLTRFPELWAGGVAWVGITDWELLYEEDMEHYRYYSRMLFGGTPEEVPERYRRASPIHEAERLRAPLLIVHGVTDPRCPVSQARRFRARLQELGKVEGKDFHYHELGEQGHGSIDIEERLATFRLIDAFLARFA